MYLAYLRLNYTFIENETALGVRGIVFIMSYPENPDSDNFKVLGFGH